MIKLGTILGVDFNAVRLFSLLLTIVNIDNQFIIIGIGTYNL